MSEPSPLGFGSLIPGFDFLQNLAGAAASGGVPQSAGLASWVTPTLSIEELDQRIKDLKTVQFWLDQNAAALKATVQALEVQKMTLATLKTMNLNVADLAAGLRPKPGAAAAGASPSSGQAAAPDGAPQPASGGADPLQWWGALTQQFQQIAVNSLQEAATRGGTQPATQAAARPAQDSAASPSPRQPARRTSARPSARSAGKGRVRGD